METEPAPAKINLTLHVTGRRADGYHLLDSLVVFTDLGDRITTRPADDLTSESCPTSSFFLPGCFPPIHKADTDIALRLQYSEL